MKKWAGKLSEYYVYFQNIYFQGSLELTHLSAQYISDVSTF